MSEPELRRRGLLMSAAALGVLGVAGCRSSSLFAGPDPLGSAPPLATDTQALEAVIAAETRLITLYRFSLAALPAHSALLGGLLAQHAQHLARLATWLVVPPGTTATPSPLPVPSPSPSPSQGPFTLARLRAAEQQSSLTFLQYLGDVQPGLAQLFASIAASDFTHQDAL